MPFGCFFCARVLHFQAAHISILLHLVAPLLSSGRQRAILAAPHSQQQIDDLAVASVFSRTSLPEHYSYRAPRSQQHQMMNTYLLYGEREKSNFLQVIFGATRKREMD
jgi:hypothetical protein